MTEQPDNEVLAKQLIGFLAEEAERRGASDPNDPQELMRSLEAIIKRTDNEEKKHPRGRRRSK